MTDEELDAWTAQQAALDEHDDHDHHHHHDDPHIH
jgi:hypothetical protein